MSKRKNILFIHNQSLHVVTNRVSCRMINDGNHLLYITSHPTQNGLFIRLSGLLNRLSGYPVCLIGYPVIRLSGYPVIWLSGYPVWLIDYPVCLIDYPVCLIGYPGNRLG